MIKGIELSFSLSVIPPPQLCKTELLLSRHFSQQPGTRERLIWPESEFWVSFSSPPVKLGQSDKAMPLFSMVLRIWLPILMKEESWKEFLVLSEGFHWSSDAPQGSVWRNNESNLRQIILRSSSLDTLPAYDILCYWLGPPQCLQDPTLSSK